MFFENTKGIHFKTIEHMMTGTIHGPYSASDLGPLEKGSKKASILTVLVFPLRENSITGHIRIEVE